MSVTINIVNWSSGALHTWPSPTAKTPMAGAVAQDAEVDQPDREHVLASPAQRAEHHPHTSKRDAPTVARDGVAVLRETV